MTKTPDTAELTGLAKALATLDDKIDGLKGQRDELAGRILDLHPDDGTIDVGGAELVIGRTRRLDLDAIEAKYPAADAPDLYESAPRLTTARVRKHFAPVDLEPFLVDSKPTVKVK